MFTLLSNEPRAVENVGTFSIQNMSSLISFLGTLGRFFETVPSVRLWRLWRLWRLRRLWPCRCRGLGLAWRAKMTATPTNRPYGAVFSVVCRGLGGFFKLRRTPRKAYNPGRRATAPEASKRLEPHRRCGSSLDDTEPESACRRESRSKRQKLEPGASVIRCRINSITALFRSVSRDSK